MTTNTIGTPDPVVTENIHTNGTIAYGTLSVTSNRGFTVEGYRQYFARHGRYQGRAEHRLHQLAKVLRPGPMATVYDQYVGQTTSISSATTTQSGSNVTTNTKQFSWPLTLAYAYNANPDGSYPAVQPA